MADLCGAQDRVRRHEKRTGVRRAKAGDYGFQPFFKIHRDSLAGYDAHHCQRLCKLPGLLPEFGVGGLLCSLACWISV